MKRLLAALAMTAAVACSPAGPPSDDPEFVLEAFDVAPGYEVNLFASEPALQNPIQMAWDAEGRLWVVCSPTYPQLEPGQPLRDYIVVLEDTDDDGRADQHTIFADGLLIPTGIEFGDGGVYVANVPELLYLADTDGDLVADVRRTVLTGFGTEDNHHAISAFVWGPGGKLYFQSGVFLHSQIETPFGVVRADDTVAFEFTPRSGRLDRYVYGSGVNPWGHDFDAWGQDFQTDGAWEGIWWLAPGQVPFHARDRVPGTNMDQSSSAGSEIVSGRHLPDDMQGAVLINQFLGHTVERYRLDDDGAGFTASEITPPLLVSNEEYFRPVDVEMGPDGAIYVLDWYNALIGHMQYNFRDPRRDHSHGRVWRITAAGRPLVAKPEIASASISELLENLRQPEDFTRYKSRRELYDRDAGEVAAELGTWVASLEPSDPDFERLRLEALWVYQTIDVRQPSLLREVLASPDHRARAAATRVLRYWWREQPDALDLLTQSVEDVHPRVRVEAVAALSHVPSAEAMGLAARVLDMPMDRHLEYALALTTNALRPYWLPAHEAAGSVFDDPDHAAFALESLNAEGAAGPLLDLLRAGQIAPSGLPDVLSRILDEGTPDALAEVFRLAFEQYEPPLLAHVLEGLARAARERGVVPPPAAEGFSAWDTEQVRDLLDNEDLPLRHAAMLAVGAWGLEGARGDLEMLAQSDSDRRAAATAIAYLGGARSTDFLDELAAESSTNDAKATVIEALALVDLSRAAARAADALASGPDVDPGPLLRPFLQRAGGSEELGLALEPVELAPDVAKLALREVNAAGQRDPTLVAELMRASDFGNPVTELSEADLADMVTAVANDGDPVRGEAVFRRAELGCFACHAIAGGGSQVGPDLSTLGTASTVDAIIESVISPDATIKEDFETVTVTTTTGELFSGILVSDTALEVVLRDATRDEISVPRALVADIQPRASLMPAGLTVTLTRPELVDLVRFLSELGRPGPFEPPTAPLARRWRLLTAWPDGVDVNDVADAITSADASSWTPAYSTVAGLLPVETLVPVTGSLAVAQTHVRVSSGGFLTVRLDADEGLELFFDGEPVSLDGEPLMEVDPGVHALTFAVDLTARGSRGLIVELAAARGSGVIFQPLRGR